MIGWLGMLGVVMWLIWRGVNDVAPRHDRKTTWREPEFDQPPATAQFASTTRKTVRELQELALRTLIAIICVHRW